MKKITANCLFLTINLLFPIVFLQCTKNCEKYFKPILSISIFPNKDTYKLGDTLIFTSIYSNSIQDWETKKFNQYKNADFHGYFGLQKLIDTPFVRIDATNSIAVKSIVGNAYKSSITYKMEYMYRNDSYLFKALIILKDTGLQYFSFSGYDGLKSLKINIINNGNCNNYLDKVFFRVEDSDSSFNRITPNGYRVATNFIRHADEDWFDVHSLYFFYVKPK